VKSRLRDCGIASLRSQWQSSSQWQYPVIARSVSDEAISNAGIHRTRGPICFARNDISLAM